MSMYEWTDPIDVDAEREAETPEDDEVTQLRRPVADLTEKVGRLEPGGGRLPEDGPGGLNAAIEAAKTPAELDAILIRSGLAGDELNPYATREHW